MDVDWRTENVYFIDNKRNHIAACKSDGGLCIEIQSLDNIATSIALAPREGYLYYFNYQHWILLQFIIIHLIIYILLI